MNFENFSLLYPTKEAQNAHFSGHDAPCIPMFVLDELGLTQIFDLRNCDLSDFFTTAPAVKKEFEKTEYAARLKATGVITSYICPLMYMNNPLAGKMPVITCSNKLRTYTTARFYTEDEILAKITKGGK